MQSFTRLLGGSRYGILSAFILFMVASSVEAMTPSQARELFQTISDDQNFNTPFKPNQHPDAQWFPRAGFGMFLHWGIYSQGKYNPSWYMIKNRFGRADAKSMPVEDYYRLADSFNPQDYDPGRWAKLAKTLDMEYVVLTTKHHDGYALWPSAYGDYNTRTKMDGRDLLTDYVAALRKEKLKVGFYFSPRDWSFNKHVSSFKNAAQGFDHSQKPVIPFSKAENERQYEAWFDYAVGQLSELLTQYGKIDVLWFDGAGWMGVKRPKDDIRLRNWIYTLQPQIVINPRWGGKNVAPNYKNHSEHHGLAQVSRAIGDYYTLESKFKYLKSPVEAIKHDIWWEYCTNWKGNWGYSPAKPVTTASMARTLRKIVRDFTHVRSFDGNYLINMSPSGDGVIGADVYAEAEALQRWLAYSREALLGGARGYKQWQKHGDVLMTRRDKRLYLHDLIAGKPKAKTLEIGGVLKRPRAATLLWSRKSIAFDYDAKSQTLRLTLSVRNVDPAKLSTIIALDFDDPDFI